MAINTHRRKEDDENFDFNSVDSSTCCGHGNFGISPIGFGTRVRFSLFSL